MPAVDTNQRPPEEPLFVFARVEAQLLRRTAGARTAHTQTRFKVESKFLFIQVELLKPGGAFKPGSRACTAFYQAVHERQEQAAVAVR